MLPNLRELAKSGVVAGNVQSTLRLTKSTRDLRRQLHATVRPQSEVIAISATDEHADYARQIAQEAAVVFAQLVDTRFGTARPARCLRHYRNPYPNRRPKPSRPCLLRPEPGISTSYKTPWTPRRASRRSRQRSGGPISTSSASMRRPTARYRVPSIR